MRGRGTAVAIGLVTMALAMAAAGAEAHDGANHVDVPTWDNPYQWPGHGYAGWVSSVAAPDPAAYGVRAGLGDQPGLWTWLTGGRRYLPGRAVWSYEAPGTTRIKRAVIQLAYRDKLFAHHCLELALRDGGSTRASKQDCTPPAPDGTERLAATIIDPAGRPSARRATVEVVMPACTKKPAACDKNIPVLDPLKNGARVRVQRVDLLLTDDDKPTVVPSGPFRDLADKYIDGRQSYGLHLAASDPGAGVSRAWITGAGVGELLSASAACDAAHHTPGLAGAVCPPQLDADLHVVTTGFPEGANDFRAHAVDVAANAADSEAWRIFVDRTAAPAPAHFAAHWEDDGESSAHASVSWIPGVDPALPDGHPGSGYAGDTYQYSINGGPWSGWRETDDAGFTVPAGELGDKVAIQAFSRDAVGNQSPLAAATVTIAEPPAGQEETLDERVQKAHDFREDFGIHIDDAAIRDLERDPAMDESRAEYGVALTSAELAEVRAREALQDDLDDIDEYADDHARTTYGGVWIDHEDGGTVKVAFTRDAAAHVDKIKAFFPSPARLRAVTVARTEGQLSGLTDEVSDDMSALADQGIEIQGVTTLRQENLVEVGVKRLTDTETDRLRTLYGAGVRPVAVEDEELEGKLDRFRRWTRMNAGLQIFAPDDSYCTIAYSAHDRRGGDDVYFHVTAGHCGWGSWEQGDRTIGKTVESAFVNKSKADALLISARRGRISNAIFGPDFRRTVTRVESISRDEHEGNMVCKSGATTGITCGKLESTDHTQGPDDLKRTHQRVATYRSDPGDSGAPVYRRTANRTAMAVGIHSGTFRKSIFGLFKKRRVYSHAELVQQRFGVTICRKGLDQCGG